MRDRLSLVKTLGKKVQELLKKYGLDRPQSQNVSNHKEKLEPSLSFVLDSLSVKD